MLDTVKIDEAAEKARLELAAAMVAGTLTTRVQGRAAPSGKRRRPAG